MFYDVHGFDAYCLVIYLFVTILFVHNFVQISVPCVCVKIFSCPHFVLASVRGSMFDLTLEAGAKSPIPEGEEGAEEGHTSAGTQPDSM